MNNWAFSPSQNTFYYLPMKSAYDNAGTWPADAIEVSDQTHNEFIQTPPAGKVLGVVNGLPAWVDIVYKSDEVYSTALDKLRINCANATAKMQVPYSFEEPASWWNQVIEAEAWMADNSYHPVMLTEMVSSSGGAWTLHDLATKIVANATAWRSGSGNILGQTKAKRFLLDKMKSDVDSGKIDIHEMLNFDCTITNPSVVIADKYLS